MVASVIEKGAKFRVGAVVENTYAGSGLPTYIPGRVTEVREMKNPRGRPDGFGNRTPGSTEYRYMVEFPGGRSGWADEDMLEQSTGKSAKSFGGFLKAVADARSPNHGTAERGQEVIKSYGSRYVREDRPSVQKSAMGEGSGQAGGYVVPPEYGLELMRTIAENSFIYPRATVVGMGSFEKRFPTIDVTTAQAAGTSPFFGGVVFKWGAQQQSYTASETEPTFREDTLRAWDLIGYAILSNQMLADIGLDGEESLLNLFGRAAAWYAEFAYLQGGGAGVSMPLGILNSPGTVSVSRSGGGHIIQADVAKVARSLLPFGWQHAIWSCSVTALEDLVKITGFVPNQWNYKEEGAVGFLLTRPVFATDKLPALGTAGDLVFFDPSLYVIGNRQEVLIDFSGQEPNTFANNQSMYRIWLRGDGRLQVNSTVTLPDAASTVVGAAVQLV